MINNHGEFIYSFSLNIGRSPVRSASKGSASKNASKSSRLSLNGNKKKLSDLTAKVT
jgi:hypothetical protein